MAQNTKKIVFFYFVENLFIINYLFSNKKTSCWPLYLSLDFTPFIWNFKIFRSISLSFENFCYVLVSYLPSYTFCAKKHKKFSITLACWTFGWLSCFGTYVTFPFSQARVCYIFCDGKYIFPITVVFIYEGMKHMLQ